MMQNKSLALCLCAILIAAPVQADFLSPISNAISSAANSVSNGVTSAATTVGSGISSATNTVGSGLQTAVNFTSKGVSTAANATSGWVSTAIGGVKDAYNVSTGTLRNWTTDVRDAVSPAAASVANSANSIGNSIYNVSTGTYQGVVDSAKNITGQNSNPSAPAPVVSADVTQASSILNTLTANSSAYIQVANSLLVALGQNQSLNVEAAIKNIINNSTGNTTYPSTAVNSTVSLSLAQAIVTGIITANNYTVTVNYNGQTNRVNATQVSNVFIAGLQDGLTPCARNVSQNSNATAGSSDYFSNIATNCCYLVSQPLTYTEALSQTNGVATLFESSLANSQSLGLAPSLDLTRCLSNTTSVS